MKTNKFLINACVLGFFFLCLLHYFSSRPLWLDENFIMENIKAFKTAELLGPLNRCQAFPRLYLILIKVLAQRFNYDVLVLRFFPLIFMLFGFFVWKKIFAQGLSQGLGSLLALFSFTSSYYLSYYAAELKPYSADVLAVGLFVCI